MPNTIGALLVATKIRSQGLAPVFVRDWIGRVIFSDFMPDSESYRDQLWVLKNSEALLYAQLVANGQVIFQEMHDVVAHIAGIRAEGYAFAGQKAKRAVEKFTLYFGPRGRGNLPSYLLPYFVGLVLDALTQMPFYRCETRAMVIDELLDSIDQLAINPHEKLVLHRFPKGIDAVIEVMRSKDSFSIGRLKSEIKNLLQECRDLTSPAGFQTISVEKLSRAVRTS